MDARGVRGRLSTVEDPARAAALLVERADDAGGPDNVTCVVVDVR
ncbi:hypothetical protein [Actinomadura sp. DC4]|nr:hypothetical protein [Actinomadura sp. DC4]MDN3357541.1 hypothetical protein [Actinomadura sp. DC4]